MCSMQVMDEIPRLQQSGGLTTTSWSIRHQEYRGYSHFLWIHPFVLKLQLSLVDICLYKEKEICNEKETKRRGISQSADLKGAPSHTEEEGYSDYKAPKWRRNPKRPQGLDGKRRTVNFMNWPNCCRCPPPSPPSWTRRPSSAWPPATWRWG